MNILLQVDVHTTGGVAPVWAYALAEPAGEYRTAGAPRLLDRVRAALRTRHYSRRTEAAYIGWIWRFILFHNKRHPTQMAESEINAFLSHLAIAGGVSASTQNQALASLLFLYRHVLEREVGELRGLARARRPQRLPVVLTREEVRQVLARLSGAVWLMASLL
jgi:site-specific recombinase XerD